MIKRNEAGLIFDSWEQYEPRARMIIDLHQELCEMTNERNWWMKCALGVHWIEAQDKDAF
jgi:hypothetical protein